MFKNRLAVGDFEINDPDLRSPSPEQAFDPSTGKQTNTRELRAREKYTREKNFIVESLLKLDNNFIAPVDYTPPIKKKKIYLPDGETGESASVGLIIGPAGKTHKDLEKRSKCKIFIRGKGSNTKSRVYNKKDNNEKEPLHVSVESPNVADLEVGVRLVNELLDPSSDHKKNQLIEIAAIRGTLRDDWCEDCGEKGHRRFECPNKINSWKKVNIQCEVCGQTTHPTRDCPMRRPGFEEENDIEDDLNDFLEKVKRVKEQKEKVIEDGVVGEENVKKENAFEEAAKKVVNVIEKEAPGSISKEVKEKIQPYTKKDDEKAKEKDRVVALRDNTTTLALNGEQTEQVSENPLKDLHNHFTDRYGKLLANEAVTFYDHHVKPKQEQATVQPPIQPPVNNPQLPAHTQPVLTANPSQSEGVKPPPVPITPQVPETQQLPPQNNPYPPAYGYPQRPPPGVYPPPYGYPQQIPPFGRPGFPPQAPPGYPQGYPPMGYPQQPYGFPQQPYPPPYGYPPQPFMHPPMPPQKQPEAQKNGKNSNE